MNKKGRSLIIILSLIIGALLCFSGYLLYDKYNSNENIDNVDNGNYLTIIDGEKVAVQSNNAKLIKRNDYYALYNDNGLKLYDFTTKEKREIDIEINDSVYFIFLDSGFIYNTYKDNNGYYDIESSSILFKNKYQSLYTIDGTEEYLIGKNKDKIYVLCIENGKEIIAVNDPSYNCDSECNRLMISYMVSYYEQIDGVEIFITNNTTEGTGGGREDSNYTFYSKDGKVILKLKNNELYLYDEFANFKIYREND